MPEGSRDSLRADWNATFISATEAKRWAGSLARALTMTASTASGRLGFTLRGCGRGSLACLSTTPIGVSAENGSRPVASWNRMTPRAY